MISLGVGLRVGPLDFVLALSYTTIDNQPTSRNQPQRLMKKSEQIKLQIAQLEGDLQVATEAERAEELSHTLPKGFNRESLMSILDNPTGFEWYLLTETFHWGTTPQGFDFWENERDNYRLHGKPLSDEAIIQIQKWVIMSYRIAFP